MSIARLCRGLTVAAALCLPLPAGAEEIASYYAWQHHGRKMANGKRFNALGLTAASRTLPLGSRLRVVNLKTHRSVVVTVTDRGPARWTRRSLDLSLGAARVLGFVKQGTARVCVVMLDAPRPLRQ